MPIQILTNVRADGFFLALWVRYYGGLFGRENLHVMLDGDDWTPECDLSGVNVHVVAEVPQRRVLRDNFIAGWQSDLATQLLQSGVPVVLRVDVDEFVATDPQAGLSLPEYLERLEPGARRAALGLDVIQGPAEGPLDPGRPPLEQRRNAVLTHEYCKLVAVRRRPHWASGFHRGRGVPVDIGRNLLLFHLALADRDIARLRARERAAVGEHHSEAVHTRQRAARFDEIAQSAPVEFDLVSGRALAAIAAPGPRDAAPRPQPITGGNVARGYHVRLPDRMTGLLPAVG